MSTENSLSLRWKGFLQNYCFCNNDLLKKICFKCKFQRLKDIHLPLRRYHLFLESMSWNSYIIEYGYNDEAYITFDFNTLDKDFFIEKKKKTLIIKDVVESWVREKLKSNENKKNYSDRVNSFIEDLILGEIDFFCRSVRDRHDKIML